MINETVLEMHFHRPLMDLFRDTFGLGGFGGFNFYKYSPQRECFVGFDQAYVKTELSERVFFEMLRASAEDSNYELGDRFLGYFLQFKVVKRLRSRRKYTPPIIKNMPHYRSDVDTKRKVTTNRAQHELLFNLNRNAGAMVYYACPMIFDREALYDVDVELDDLRLADLDGCPSSYIDNQSHFIYFDGPREDAVWCSEPVVGSSIGAREFVDKVRFRLERLDPKQSRDELVQLLTNIKAIDLDPKSEMFQGRNEPTLLPLVSESLTILRVSNRK